MMAEEYDNETGEIKPKKSNISRLATATVPNETIDITSLINGIGGGNFKADADHELTRLIKAIVEIAKNENRDCKGSITLKIEVSTRSGALIPQCSVATKLPASKPVSGVVFGDEDGNLFSKDPDQGAFNFR